VPPGTVQKSTVRVVFVVHEKKGSPAAGKMGVPKTTLVMTMEVPIMMSLDVCWRPAVQATSAVLESPKTSNFCKA